MARALGDDPVELSSHELEPLVGQERQAVALHPQVVGVQRADDERLLPQRRLATTDPSGRGSASRPRT